MERDATPLAMNGDQRLSLFDLLGRDKGRLAKVLCEYRRAAVDELLQLDAAIERGDGIRTRMVAHRAAMACHLIGERCAGASLESLANASRSTEIDPLMTQCITHARAALVASIARASFEP